MCIRDRNTNLSEIVRTGTPVNSAVNLEVLGTIFYEGTPLHDGAAIIEAGRIKACLLYTSSMVILAFTSKNRMAPKAEGIPYDKGAMLFLEVKARMTMDATKGIML